MIEKGADCYLCGGRGPRVHEGFPWLVRCTTCGLVYNPDFSIDPVDVARRFYDDDNTEHRRRIQGVGLRIALGRWRWLAGRLDAQRGRLLEVGCGTGEFLTIAMRAGWHVQGSEFSQPFREAAKAWYNLNVVGDVQAARSAAGAPFDAVALLHVFEHLRDPIGFLGELHGITRPRGWLFIVVPNLRSWTDKLFCRANPTLLKRDHLFHFDPNTLQQAVGRAGYDVAAMATLEPAHHLWTSLYGYMSSRGGAGNPRGVRGRNAPRLRGLLSNTPYWIGAIAAPMTSPLRACLGSAGTGHEIYLLARKKV